MGEPVGQGSSASKQALGPGTPVIALGASAGGLAAFETFLRHLPDDLEAAVVVVQHLDPDHKGALVELLQRVTDFPVHEAAEDTQVEPGNVYVIPSNADLTILHGRLHLFVPTESRGLRLPIDTFFRSLAEDAGERAIGVVLSGMGSDGTLGLAAIKANEGATFVQSPETAEFDAMPHSAIASGVADVVAPVEELPGRVVAYLRHAPLMASDDASAAPARGALERVMLLLRSRTGHDFSLYKPSTLRRRIDRRMGLHQLPSVSDYVAFLQENPAEIDLLFKELLIGVTSFFRDPESWDEFKVQITRYVERVGGGRALRAWVAGCSTGEEAYSLAMIFRELTEDLDPSLRCTLQVFATDLDTDAIDRARAGLFPASIATDVTAQRLERFFVEEAGGYRVRKEIREMVVFAPQNVTQDPPFTRLDFLSCRNLLIYLTPELQSKIIPLFHYSLLPGGLLFLGTAETIGGFTDMFRSVEGRARIYERRETLAGGARVDFPSSIALPHDAAAGALRTQDDRTLQALADRLILDRFSPAAVLVTDEGDIVYISGRTGRYLEPPAGKANLNVFAMAREELRYEINSAFLRARGGAGRTTVRGVPLGTEGEAVDITVELIEDPVELRGMIAISFTPALAEQDDLAELEEGEQPDPARVLEMARELKRAREEIQTVRADMQASAEEMRSINEELQSANEELQSTNEELTTSKEEIQSMNEELQTVNQELETKVRELTSASNDMQNLLNSTEIATIFLDGELRVRRFTEQASEIIRLRPSDAGRPMTDITSDLDYPDIVDDARRTLRTLVSVDKLVQAKDGRWFNVRIMPYRTMDNVIDGVVITFIDVSKARRLEEELRAAKHTLEQQVASQDQQLRDAGVPEGGAAGLGE